MPTLFVRCPKCRTEFPSRLALMEPERATLLVSGLELKCPRCGTTHSYFTKDFHAAAVTVEGSDGPGGAPPEPVEPPSPVNSPPFGPWRRVTPR